MTEFSISRLPRIEFGAGTLAKLPAIARRYGAHALLVTGTGSLKNSPFWPDVTAGLKVQGISWLHLAIPGEPSPQMVDEAVRALRTEPVDVVIGVGGGSALDAAKAIAGLLKPGNSVMDHLEGVGPELPYAPCHPVHRRADYGGHWFGSNQEYGIKHAGGGWLQKVLPRRETGGGSRADRSGSFGDLSACCHRGERHGCLHPVAGILCLQPRR